MPKSGAELKAQVMAELEAVVEAALGKAEQTTGLTLTDIEAIVLKARGEVGEQLTKVLVEQESGLDVPGPRCAECGQEMHLKGRKPRYVRTRTGTVQVERAYYYCDRCRSGLFPPG